MGFKDKEILLMPLDNLDGIRPGSEVVATGNSPSEVSPRLVGRILDG